MTKNLVVSVENLHKTFVLPGAWPWSPKQEVMAVQGVNIHVKPGEIIALVGQSGSGKTTVSRMILGLEDVTSGSITLDGIRWDGLSESERRPLRAKFQYVPQDSMSALNPQQTAWEHITETYQVLGSMSHDDALKKAQQLLESLGLGQRLHALPREMSGGEQRRVTLARVLALEPKLIVADEPTSGLDPDRRDSVLEALFGNLPENAGCILVTHDMSEAKQWCNRIYVMLAGRVIEELDLHAHEPKHPYAQLLFDPWNHPLPQKELAKKGCPFHTNCSIMLQSICTGTLPSLQPVQSATTSHTVQGATPYATHMVACHACTNSQTNTNIPPNEEKSL